MRRAGTSPETPPEEVEARIAAFVDEVYAELRPIVDDADSQLAGLTGQLTGPACDGFAAYPDTAAFVPQPGRPIGWNPEHTQPASGDATRAAGASPAGNVPPDGSSINNWDSNAAKGTPSKGLMQTIDPPRTPCPATPTSTTSSPASGMRSTRYGSVSNVPGVVGAKTGSGYRGY